MKTNLKKTQISFPAIMTKSRTTLQIWRFATKRSDSFHPNRLSSPRCRPCGRPSPTRPSTFRPPRQASRNLRRRKMLREIWNLSKKSKLNIRKKIRRARADVQFLKTTLKSDFLMQTRAKHYGHKKTYPVLMIPYISFFYNNNNK